MSLTAVRPGFAARSIRSEADNGVNMPGPPGDGNLSLLYGPRYYVGEVGPDDGKVLRVRALDQIGPSGELTWGGRVDLCPDSLYLRVTGKKAKDIFPALRQESARV